MNKIYIIILCIFSLTFTANSESVGQKEARRVAQTFLNAVEGEELPHLEYVYNGRKLTTERLFSPFYVFNCPTGGFVIVSAENKAFPILAYGRGRNNIFREDRMTDEEREMLTGFARDIELVRYDSRIPSEAVAAWEDLNGLFREMVSAPNSLPGDFYRYYPDNSRLWIVRNRAVEFPYVWPKTDEEIRSEELLRETMERADEPFEFYESFMETSRREAGERLASLEERLHPDRPVVKSLGGAHFTIDMPGCVRLVDIYNVGGALVARQYYNGYDSVSVDLSDQPSGFYFALIHMDNGNAVGVKLYR